MIPQLQNKRKATGIGFQVSAIACMESNLQNGVGHTLRTLPYVDKAQSPPQGTYGPCLVSQEVQSIRLHCKTSQNHINTWSMTGTARQHTLPFKRLPNGSWNALKFPE
jgi:hypothetical protein